MPIKELILASLLAVAVIPAAYSANPLHSLNPSAPLLLRQTLKSWRWIGSSSR